MLQSELYIESTNLAKILSISKLNIVVSQGFLVRSIHIHQLDAVST